MRVVKWIVDRVHDRVGAAESPFGLMPRYEDITWGGLDFSKKQYEQIMDISRAGALSEIQEVKDFFSKFGSHLPAELERQRQQLAERAEKAPEVWHIAAAA
jgi:phosphoenolpyruvate carboxykinase (GTP)